MITFCIPSKNNLRYLKTCVPSIQLNSHYTTNEVLVFVDQDNDGTVEWLEENNIRYILNKALVMLMILCLKKLNLT
jgi:glycosyltransferase involved in cell wall biosynthesis